MDYPSMGNGGPSKAAIDEGVREAFEAAGYVQPDGEQDLSKLRQAIMAIVREAKVLNKRERSEKAVTRGTLVARLFPELAGPNDWDGDLFQQRVYEEVSKKVWGQTSPNAGGPVQKMVGHEFGNGYVLCRTQIGPDRAPAVYVTDDFGCIDQDFVWADNAKFERMLKTVTDNREMLVLRQPQNAKKYVSGYKNTFQTALTQGQSRMALALDTAVARPSDEEGEDEEDQE